MSTYVLWWKGDPAQIWKSGKLCLAVAEGEEAADRVFRKALDRDSFLEPIETEIEECRSLAISLGCEGLWIVGAEADRLEPLPEAMPWE
jgi:hypothetical protein